MGKAFNGGGNNGVRVFPNLAVKAGVAYGRLRLLIKLRFVAAVKELGRNGNCLACVSVGEGGADFVRFVFHALTLRKQSRFVHRVTP